MAKAIPFKVFVTGELVTVADLNQIAENASPQVDYVQQTNAASAIATQNAATWGTPIYISHTTRTGRVRVYVQLSIENATGAAIAHEHVVSYDTTVALGLTVTGSATNGLVVLQIPNGQEQSVTYSYILSGLTPGTLYYFGAANRRTVGAGTGTIRSYLIYSEDV